MSALTLHCAIVSLSCCKNEIRTDPLRAVRTFMQLIVKRPRQDTHPLHSHFMQLIVKRPRQDTHPLHSHFMQLIVKRPRQDTHPLHSHFMQLIVKRPRLDTHPLHSHFIVNPRQHVLEGKSENLRVNEVYVHVKLLFNEGQSGKMQFFACYWIVGRNVRMHAKMTVTGMVFKYHLLTVGGGDCSFGRENQ